MKKGIIFGIVLLFCISLLGGTAYAAFDLKGELTYDMDTETSGGFTEVATNLDLSPLNFKFTWNRVWLPSVSDSLKLNAGITAGIFGLNYERELLKADAGIATLTLNKEPIGIKYVRSFDGIDTGTVTITLTVVPLTFEYIRDLDVDAVGTIKVGFEKSF